MSKSKKARYSRQPGCKVSDKSAGTHHRRCVNQALVKVKARRKDRITLKLDLRNAQVTEEEYQ